MATWKARVRRINHEAGKAQEAKRKASAKKRKQVEVETIVELPPLATSLMKVLENEDFQNAGVS